MIITNKSNLLRGQGLGDATTPLLCAIIFNILNFFSDHIFIRRCNLGIVGSALATLLSQTLALILMMVKKKKKVPIRWFQLKYSSFIDYLARYGKAGMYLLARSMARVGAFSYCSRQIIDKRRKLQPEPANRYFFVQLKHHKNKSKCLRQQCR